MTNEARIAKDLLRLAKIIAATGENENGNAAKKDDEEDKAIQEIKNAFKNPKPFFDWLNANKTTTIKEVFNENTLSGAMKIRHLFSMIISKFPKGDK